MVLLPLTFTHLSRQRRILNEETGSESAVKLAALLSEARLSERCEDYERVYK